MVIRIRVWNGNVENSILQWGCSFESGSNCSVVCCVNTRILAAMRRL